MNRLRAAGPFRLERRGQASAEVARALDLETPVAAEDRGQVGVAGVRVGVERRRPAGSGVDAGRVFEERAIEASGAVGRQDAGEPRLDASGDRSAGEEDERPRVGHARIIRRLTADGG